MSEEENRFTTSSRLLSIEPCLDIDDMDKLFINDFDNIFQWQQELEDSFSDEREEIFSIGAFESLEQPFIDEDGTLRIYTKKIEKEKQGIVQEKENEKQEMSIDLEKEKQLLHRKKQEKQCEEEKEIDKNFQTNKEWLSYHSKEKPITYWNIGYDSNFDKKY
ncbi:hypothetical protein M0812_13046 [Anaeramoeba flamelloides]|uniref:Uncharacterized protein n=1 Tax=Anaeramoeba flamelloides TaxID=1746091 RepID=A0AAV7ZG90_9EUKA|nr:hypothetical protein M0812_13046 [Anaeramoeba flamelloides]